MSPETQRACIGLLLTIPFIVVMIYGVKTGKLPVLAGYVIRRSENPLLFRWVFFCYAVVPCWIAYTALCILFFGIRR